MRKWYGWLYKRWMLFGIFLARHVSPLEKWKMAVGDGMVLACALTMPAQPDMSPWPDGALPLLVMFRPPKGSPGPHELWEAELTPGNAAPAKDLFRKTNLVAMPLFEGKVFAFITNNFDSPAHYYIRCHDGGAHVDSGIVVSKLHERPTRFSMDKVSVHPGKPIRFQWPPSENPAHWIHFLTVSQGDRLMTGIYSRATEWAYPRLTDLPYYIHDPLDAPALEPGAIYQLMYMAVDIDGWVSDLCQRMFQL